MYLIVKQRFLQLKKLQKNNLQHIYHKLAKYLSTCYILSEVVKKHVPADWLCEMYP